MKKILCVEDNDSYRELLVSELIGQGYKVDHSDSPVKGLELVALNKYDLVISDLKLPVMSGTMFTESVKNISPDTVCMILTGEADISSEIKSIEKNIDLYLEKDKALEVIMSYIAKLLHESEEKPLVEGVITSRAEGIVLNTTEHTVTKNDNFLNLTPKEFEILKMFLLNKNQVISRDEFVDHAWEEPFEEVDVRLVDTHIKKLRDKLKSFSIMTVRGYGYRWNEIE